MSAADQTKSLPLVQIDHGSLPPWRKGDLPEPLPFSIANTFRTIGPGAILLVAAIGGGEWIVGPLMTVKYGPGILWVATVAIVLQSLFNLEAVRYTLYTGEPIITGFMRLRPGSGFWSVAYIVLGVAQLAVPALALGSATVLYAAFVGRMPNEGDRPIHLILTSLIILGSVGLLLSGRSVERILERASWAMVVFIFSFLVLVNIFCVPPAHSARIAQGFLTYSPIPPGIDLVLLGLFAATAGSGGLGNLTISSWFRDKGFGMGAHMGAIGGALSAQHTDLATVGCVFPPTPENLRRWRTWWRYALLDQSALWGVGCVLGMYLNVNLASAIIPPGEQVKDIQAGTFQAEHLAAQFWSGLWLLTLLNGFWILYSTHLGNTDCLTRTIVDICWTGQPWVRRWSASRIYAVVLAALTVVGLIAIHFGNVVDLFKVLGIVASPILALAALQIWRVNTRFLPREVRPPLWRQAALLLCALVYGGITVALVLDAIRKLRG